MKGARYLAFGATLAWLSACAAADGAPAPYLLQLQAALPDATPLTGVRFWVGGRELGPTGVDGRVSATFTGHEGDALRATALCPIGYHGSAEARMIKLQRVTTTVTTTSNATSNATANTTTNATSNATTNATSTTQRASPLTFSWRCVPEQASAALVVRARRGSTPLTVPILVDGRVVGQTDALGVGHVLVHGAPHATLQARLDTSALPNLLPRDPVRVFDVDEQDTILLFDQSFETRRRTLTRHDPRPARPRVPLRIE